MLFKLFEGKSLTHHHLMKQIFERNSVYLVCLMMNTCLLCDLMVSVLPYLFEMASIVFLILVILVCHILDL